ncbi:MAG: VanZ family protein [Saprospiraceae bacterium]|nr:VanZ family protein [Saprospiraceae bacterium]HMW39605.1 VanZ family protein [Saprospiraceae bacterium]HMX89326.1 VanZ family protein [Saprospiraceae bacterium]HMZ41218.1 VanZ family protein [Saprospiraceae bacterium]HNA65313.1 VanZ family protein [Saprospiraceae bacterium]
MKSVNREIKLWRALGFLDVLTINVLSLISAGNLNRLIPLQFSYIDKLGHILFYGFASFCFCKMAILKSNNSSYAIKRIVAGLLLMGAILEIIQYLSRMGRQFDIWDLVANGLGIFAGWALSILLTSKSGTTNGGQNVF